MELVEGKPITDYCSEHKLSIRERLKLFMRLCHGVQHAHQKGIIHRDLKPGNVLVKIQDGEPIVKIIDFGIAKALHHDLIDNTTGHDRSPMDRYSSLHEPGTSHSKRYRRRYAK